MPDLGDILAWLRYRKIARNRKTAERVLLELNSLTVTIHGRQMLSAVCKDEENGLPDEIKRMYWILLQQAPIQQYAQMN